MHKSIFKRIPIVNKKRNQRYIQSLQLVLFEEIEIEIQRNRSSNGKKKNSFGRKKREEKY
jgi:hypothetical protein